VYFYSLINFSNINSLKNRNLNSKQNNNKVFEIKEIQTKQVPLFVIYLLQNVDKQNYKKIAF